ncbi:hypothetical protein [Paenibacillus elgii]|uniref:hypothetical protein n=1 Tax=Paenibacillus elgii TaxID=189691 RepID=UPI002040C082|nr:hypothetical protein [Paenibacillus elgii]MCM3270874.1 hypothetical protein [Paenibacillus elgii]
MRIEVNEDMKHVSIYLSDAFEEVNSQVIKHFKNKKYSISKFISGERDYSEIIQQIILNH